MIPRMVNAPTFLIRIEVGTVKREIDFNGRDLRLGFKYSHGNLYNFVRNEISNELASGDLSKPINVSIKISDKRQQTADVIEIWRYLEIDRKRIKRDLEKADKQAMGVGKTLDPIEKRVQKIFSLTKNILTDITIGVSEAWTSTNKKDYHTSKL